MKWVVTLMGFVSAFENVHRPYFGYRNYELVLSKDCFFEPHISEITDIELEDDESFRNENFIVYGRKSISKTDKLPVCSQCNTKCKIFKMIKDEFNKSSYKHTGIENLNFLTHEDNGKTLYCVCRIDEIDYYVTVNCNRVENAGDLIFLLSCDERGTLKSLFQKTINSDSIEIRHQTLSASKQITADDEILSVLKKGAGILTFRRLLMAIGIYYVVGSVALVGYFGIYKKDHR